MSVIPNNGSIVIIDDKINEALPLINFLSKKNKAYKYFNGEPQSLPSSTIEEAVRIVFLDYNLIPAAATNDITNLDRIIQNFRKIISHSNGPFFIFLWSQNQDNTEDFLNKFNERIASLELGLEYLIPWAVESLTKADFFESIRGQEDYQFILGQEQTLATKIEERMSSLPLLEFFSKWENKLLLTEQDLISEVIKLLTIGNIRKPAPAKKIVELLSYLELESTMSSASVSQKHKAAYQSLNRLLINNLQKTTENINVSSIQNVGNNIPDGFEIEKINSLVNVNYLENPSHMGKVFVYENDFFDHNLVNDTEHVGQFNKAVEECQSESIGFYKNIILEISPECDIAQNKRNFYRFVHGCIVSKDMLDNILSREMYSDKFRFKKESNNMIFEFKDTIFDVFCFYYKDYEQAPVYMILDFAQTSTYAVDKFSCGTESLFSINGDMLNTIKNRLAGLIYKKGYQKL